MARPHLRLIALAGLIVPRRLRADWRQEWETELHYREMLLADWDRLDWRHKLDLLRRSTSAFWDALWLQKRRLEADVFQDLRYGVRMLFSHPGFTAVAVVTLTLGIGANAAIFTLLDKVLIRPLPVERPDQLVAFVNESRAAAVVSYPLYTELRDRNQALSGLIAYFQRPFSLSDGARSDRVVGQIVSGNYFAVLGVRPALGRFFLPEEDRTPGTHPVAVIGHGLWRRYFDADPRVLGRTITLSGHDVTVIGVAPSEFNGTSRGTVTDVYVPTMMQAQMQPGSPMMLTNRNSGWLRLVGRLKPRVTRAQAQAEVSLLAEETTKPYSVMNGQPAGKKGPPAKSISVLVDGSRGHTDRVEGLSLPLTLMMGVVGCVLLIACANVANLLLARASARRHEIAVRLATGASRFRIVRQLLTESTILAALGAAGALGVAFWITDLLLAFQPQTSFVPRMIDSSLDGRAIAFTLGMSVLTWIVFSLGPALQTVRPEFVAALKQDMPRFVIRGRRLSVRNLLVVTQVALSLVVLVGASLCVKSLRTLQAVDPGFEPAKVVTASFDLRVNGYDEARGRRLISSVVEKVTTLPGVEAVSLANIIAFSDLFWIGGMRIDGYQQQPGERMAFDFNSVGPDYFRTMGISLLSGRDFNAQDVKGGSRVIIVNEATARRYWPGQDAVGQRTDRGEVVGVVRNSKEKGLGKDAQPAVYLPLTQSYVPELTLHVRTAIDPQAVLAAVRREIGSLDATLPVFNLRTMAEQKDGSLYTERMAATLLTLFGVLALTVAAVGIYGLLSYAVTERTREMGIRLAHGAEPRDLLKLVVGQGMLLTLIGLVTGLGGAFALTRLIQRMLFGVSATDPLTFVVIPVLLASVALVACWMPARRATRVNPLAALRYE